MKKVSDSGLKIKFNQNELIENCMASKNISFHAICGPAHVYKAHENETLNDILPYRKHPMAYIFRYKLIKEISYKLVPVSWLPGEEELRQTDDFSDIDEQNMYTDTDDQSEAVADLSAKINQLHTSFTKTDESPLVSPIKIVNNAVLKVTRSHSKSSKKRASPDLTVKNPDVSPSKRNKLLNNSNYTFESPTIGNGRLSSPAQSEMNKIRKNLNQTFTETDDDLHFVSKINEEQPLKLLLTKESFKPAQILRERNENTTQNSQKTNNEVAHHILRRSILKNPDSEKSECFEISILH